MSKKLYKNYIVIGKSMIMKSDLRKVLYILVIVVEVLIISLAIINLNQHNAEKI